MAPSASLTNSTMSCCGCLLGSFVMTSMSSRPCVKSWYNCFFRSSFKLAVMEGFNLVQVRLGSAAISQLQNVSSFALCQLSSHLSNQLSAQLSAQLHPVTSYALCLVTIMLPIVMLMLYCRSLTSLPSKCASEHCQGWQGSLVKVIWNNGCFVRI